MRCDAMRCDAMRCDAMRCVAMRCDAMRCDAMRCDAMRQAHAYVSERTYVHETQTYARAYEKHVQPFSTPTPSHSVLPDARSIHLLIVLHTPYTHIHTPHHTPHHTTHHTHHTQTHTLTSSVGRTAALRRSWKSSVHCTPTFVSAARRLAYSSGLTDSAALSGA